MQNCGRRPCGLCRLGWVQSVVVQASQHSNSRPNLDRLRLLILNAHKGQRVRVASSADTILGQLAGLRTVQCKALSFYMTSAARPQPASWLAQACNLKQQGRFGDWCTLAGICDVRESMARQLQQYRVACYSKLRCEWCVYVYISLRPAEVDARRKFPVVVQRTECAAIGLPHKRVDMHDFGNCKSMRCL